MAYLVVGKIPRSIVINSEIIYCWNNVTHIEIYNCCVLIVIQDKENYFQTHAAGFTRLEESYILLFDWIEVTTDKRS